MYDLEHPPLAQWRDEQDRSEWFEEAARHYAARYAAARTLLAIEVEGSLTHADRVRTVRRELIALNEEAGPTPLRELTDVLDAWDRYEYAAGTAEGESREVLS